MEDPPQNLSTWQTFLRDIEEVPLLNPWWAIGAAAVTVALIVLMVIVVRRRHRWWLLALIPMTLVSLVLAVGFAVNYKLEIVDTMGKFFGIPPYDPGTPDEIARPSGTWPRGKVIEVSIPGTTSGVGAHPALVYLPPQYFSDSSATFPVAYALHGTPGVPDPRGNDYGPNDIMVGIEADNAGQVAAKEGHPVVIIAPVVSPMSGDTECVDGPMGKWETYLTKDVPDWAAQYPRFRTGAANTAIGGFSMGGTCAQNTALRHPGQYSISGNLSGYAKAFTDGGDAVLFGTGPNAAKPSDYESRAIIASQPASRTVRLWLGVGAADGEAGLVADMTSFAEFARGYGMTVELEVYPVPAGHDFSTWKPAFREWLPWAADLMYSDPAPTASGAPSPTGTRGASASPHSTASASASPQRPTGASSSSPSSSSSSSSSSR